MKILIFGKTGQVATELQRLCAGKSTMSLIALGREDVDLSEPEACTNAILVSGADAVINAAAFTAVDRAEREQEIAWRINVEAPGAMALACAERELPFLQISTDYVFDGSGTRPWSPKDQPAPLNTYGRTKLAGEERVRAAAGPHAILRTSWVFSAHGNNFLKTMVRLSESQDMVSVVADQIGGPTPAAEIAETLLVMAQAMARGHEGGTYHFSGVPEVSWAEFAREIFRQLGRTVEVRDIATADWPTLARRPLNSRLDNTALLSDFGVSCPDWQKGLVNTLKQLKG